MYYNNNNLSLCKIEKNQTVLNYYVLYWNLIIIWLTRAYTLRKLELYLSWYSFLEEGRKIYSHWIDSMRDSQARRLVVDSLQRNPRATWTYTRPIKMCVAFYIERDRSHDTPCATPMGIFYRGEFVRTSADTCVCVHMCILHICLRGSNGNQRARIFIGSMLILIICFVLERERERERERKKERDSYAILLAK